MVGAWQQWSTAAGRCANRFGGGRWIAIPSGWPDEIGSRSTSSGSWGSGLSLVSHLRLEPEVVLDWSVSLWWLFFLGAFLKFGSFGAQLTEDRRCGALELLLTSPLNVKRSRKAKPSLCGGNSGTRRTHSWQRRAFVRRTERRLFIGDKTEAVAMFAAGMILLVAGDHAEMGWNVAALTSVPQGGR